MTLREHEFGRASGSLGPLSECPLLFMRCLTSIRGSCLAMWLFLKGVTAP